MTGHERELRLEAELAKSREQIAALAEALALAAKAVTSMQRQLEEARGEMTWLR